MDVALSFGDLTSIARTAPQGAAIDLNGRVCTVLEAAHAALATRPDVSYALHGIRKLRHGEKGKRVTYFPSLRNRATVPAESGLEALNCLVIERDLGIKKYRTQPFALALGGGTYHVLDLLLERVGGGLIAQAVKPSGELLNPEVRSPIDAAGAHIKAAYVGFQIVTEMDLPGEADALGLSRLYIRRPNVHPTIILRSVEPLLATGAPTTLGRVQTTLVASGLSPSFAGWLVFHRFFEARLDFLITANTLLTVPARATSARGGER